MRDIFDLIKKEFLTYENIEKHFEEINRNGDIFSNFMQCDLGNGAEPLIYNKSIFNVTEDNKYIAKFTFPSFITPDMIDIDVIDEKRTLTISSHFKDDNGTETSSATMEHLPDDADTNSITATFDNGTLYLTMDKLTKKTLPKTIDIRHI